MCGIIGCVLRAGSIEAEACEQSLSEGIARLRHRGPDDSGVWSNGRGVGLAHARLAILDLSSHGHQPMQSSDRRFVMVYNGEIYNFAEVRELLEAQGFSFHGNGDSEVVLAAFQAWGLACVEHFIGMFAIAIWDGLTEKLFLLRDRLGVKPLYYSFHNGHFLFASELKALHCFAHWKPEIDRQALGEYLQYGYISAPRSIYRQAMKLLPGHWLELDTRSGNCRSEAYWCAAGDPEEAVFDDSEEELSERLEALLVSAFSYRMVSDVPAGVFLSGGVDSSLVAAILQARHGGGIDTYTIGFEEKPYDESAHARSVAEHLGTQHHEYKLSLERARGAMSKVPALFDEPFADPASIPTYIMSSLARQDVKVVLSADGGDELFAGYDRYVCNVARFQKINRQPRWKKRLARLGMSTVPAAWLAGLGSRHDVDAAASRSRKLAKLQYVLAEPSPSRVFQASESRWLPSEVEGLLQGYRDPRFPVSAFTGCFEEQMMQWDVSYELSDDMLAKVDRVTMSVGLEGREPLLDHRLVEFARRLPLHLKIGGLGQKHLLKKVLYKYVPRHLVDRPKAGFTVPIHRWLSEDRAQLFARIAAMRPVLQGYMDLALLDAEMRIFMQRGINADKIWMIYVLCLWMESERLGG